MAGKSLEIQIASLQRDLAVAKKDLKASYLKQGIYQAMVAELQEYIVPVDPLPSAVRVQDNRKIKESLVMHVSDAHADEVVEAEKVGNLENYNFDVALCRAETYVDTVIDFTQSSLQNYQFDDLWFLSYGDMTSGTIHDAESRSAYRNQIRNCLAIARMQSLMLRDLSSVFRNIRVVCLSGNHGRRTIRKDYEGAQSNWDYLIAEMTRIYCSRSKNIDFQIPNSWSTVVNINGWNFHVTHGDDIKSWNSIPYYGIERATRRLTALHHSCDIKVHYYVLGHHHTCSSLADLRGETFINGAWAATTPYSFNSFAGFREPMQLLHGVHADYGVSWRLPVKLKNDKREKEGPTRYIGARLENEEFDL